MSRRGGGRAEEKQLENRLEASNKELISLRGAVEGEGEGKRQLSLHSKQQRNFDINNFHASAANLEMTKVEARKEEEKRYSLRLSERKRLSTSGTVRSLWNQQFIVSEGSVGSSEAWPCRDGVRWGRLDNSPDG